MLRACQWRPHAATVVPSVVHVDGTGRVQTVDRDDQPILWRLLQEFRERTGVGVLLNTLFNLAGHPIVEPRRTRCGACLPAGCASASSVTT